MGNKNRSRMPKYQPTPEDIRLGCEEINAGWSDEHAAKRAGGLASGPVTIGETKIAQCSEKWRAISDFYDEGEYNE